MDQFLIKMGQKQDVMSSEVKESEDVANENEHVNAGGGMSRQTAGVQSKKTKGTRLTRLAQVISREMG